MKICWDNLEILRYNKKKRCWYNKKYHKYLISICTICGEEYLGRIDSSKEFCTLTCFHKSDKLIESVIRAHKDIKLSKDHKRKISKSHKNRIWSKEQIEQRKRQLDLARSKRTEKSLKAIGDAHRGDKNHSWKGGVTEADIALYDTYAPQLELYEEVRRDSGNYDWLQVRCAYSKCRKSEHGGWFTPKRESVRRRIYAIKGYYENSNKQNRFYCSEVCKQLCPSFNQVLHLKGAKPYNSRDPMYQVWAKMVKERDGYECQRCGSKEDLIAHHFEGLQQNIMMSLDIGMGITLCKECERKAHRQKGCSYYDMQKRNVCK